MRKLRWTPANIIWLVLYLLAMASIVVGLRHYREKAIATYGTPEAEANWQQWRAAAESMSQDGAVARRPPKSAQPPPLVLMRDHFAACLGISLLLSSCLFGWIMICVRGVLRPAVPLHDEPARATPSGES